MLSNFALFHVPPIRRKCRVCVSSDRSFILGQFIARNHPLFVRFSFYQLFVRDFNVPAQCFLEATWICPAGSCRGDADVCGSVGGFGS